MLGTSPFIGAGQFRKKAYEYRKKFFYNESKKGSSPCVDYRLRSREYIKGAQSL
jgi:hypothetical protein